MGMQNFVDPQYWQPSAAAALASSASEASLMAATLPIPANFFYVGRTLKGEAWGKISDTSTPTFRWRLRYGGLTGTLLLDSGALTLASGISNLIWRLTFTIVCRAIGSGTSGSLMPYGQLTCGIGTFATDRPQMLGSAGASAPAAVGVDTTSAQDLTLTGQWSASSSSNTCTLDNFDVIAIN